MSNKEQKPAWWMLYLLMPGVIGLLVLASKLPLVTWEYQVVDAIIVLFVFGLMALWVHANQSALTWDEVHQTDWSEMRIQVYEPESSDGDENGQPTEIDFLSLAERPGSAGLPRRDSLGLPSRVWRN